MRLRGTPLAERDLNKIAPYIRQVNPLAAVRFVLELIDQAETLLRGSPAIGRAGRLLGTRELMVGQLPYILAYRLRGDEVAILRVLNTSRARPEEGEG